jgi:hypothetical protein
MQLAAPADPYHVATKPDSEVEKSLVNRTNIDGPVLCTVAGRFSPVNAPSNTEEPEVPA